MNQQDFITALNQFSQDTQAYGNSIPTAYENFAVARITMDRAETYPYILSEDWVALKQYNLSQMAHLELKIQEMQVQQIQINVLVQRLFELKTGFDEHYPAPVTQSNWQTIKNQLSLELLNGGVNQQNTESLLNNLGKRGGLNFYNFYKKQYQNIADLLDYAFERHLSLYMYHYNSSVIASYNLLNLQTQNLSYNVSQKILNIQNSIKSKNTGIYQSVKSNNPSLVLSKCNDFDNWLVTQTNTNILPILAYASQKKNSVNSSITVDGRRSMKAASMLQNIFLAKATLKWTAWNISWHPELKGKIEILTAANNLVNTNIILQGQSANINHVATNPLAYDNLDILIEGSLQSLQILHLSATKVLSVAEIKSPLNKIVKIVLPHFKLDSTGLVNGSYVKISGKFLVSNSEAQNQAALSVKRFSFSNMSITNWQAWLRHQTRSIFQPVSHNLSTDFSLETGSNGAINPIKYDTTYSKPNLLTIKTNIL